MSRAKECLSFRDSGIPWLGKIRAHWAVTRLKFVAEVQGGLTLGKNYGAATLMEYPYLRVANVQDGYLDLSDVATILVPETEAESCLLKAGDVLMNEGGDADKLGRGCIWTGEIVPCLHQNHVFAVRPRLVRSEWLNAWTSTEVAKAFFESRAKQSTNLASISATNIKELPIPVPPVDEQRAIADYLDRETERLDRLIAAKERLLGLLAEKRRALITRAVTRGLDPRAPLSDSGIPWLGEIPVGWTVAQLRRFTRFVTSGSRGWAEHYADKGAIFVRIGNLTRNSVSVDLSDIQYVDPPLGAEGERTRIEPGDLLFSITAYLGSVAIAPDNLSGAYINQHIALVRLVQEVLMPSFAAYVALSHVGQAQLNGQGYGGTKIQLALDDVGSLWLPIPPKSEQRAIVDYITAETAKLDALRAATERTIALLKERRAALIAAAVTGRFHIPEAA